MYSTKEMATYVVMFAIGIFCLRDLMQGPPCGSVARIDGKVVIVTGANTGIGKEAVKDLVYRGGRVYMACRSLERGEAARRDILEETGADWSRVSVLQLDLASLDSTRSFVTNFKSLEDHLDILINNAGLNRFTRTYTTVDGLEETFAVNHLGPFLLTNLLLEHLLAAPSARVVTVSSSFHDYSIDWNDLMLKNDQSTFKGVWCYMQSKLANILFTKELARRLEGTNVTTYAVHPGAVTTEIYRSFFTTTIAQTLHFMLAWPVSKSMYQGAQTQICCAVDEKLASESGKYYSDCAEAAPSQVAESVEDAKRLWRISVELVQLQDNELHPLARVDTS